MTASERRVPRAFFAIGFGALSLAGCAAVPSVAPQTDTDAFVRAELLRANVISADPPAGPAGVASPAVSSTMEPVVGPSSPAPIRITPLPPPRQGAAS